MTKANYTPAALASRIACQTFIGVSGVWSVLMPSSLSASITPLATQGGPPIAAGFAAALGAQRIGAAGRGLIERDLDRRNVVGAWHAVILVARRQQLSFAVVGHALIQRLSNALGNTAVNLPSHQHRIHGNADVIDRGVAHHTADTGLRIDFDLADMSAVRPARAVDFALAVHTQARAIFFFRDLEQ